MPELKISLQDATSHQKNGTILKEKNVINDYENRDTLTFLKGIAKNIKLWAFEWDLLNQLLFYF
jgi:hypothetical protein